MKKKALIKLAAAFLLAAAGAAFTLEWNGYRPLDRGDGGNVLCEKDSSCRVLTQGEIELARSVFGDTIDYSHVKIFNRPYYHRPALTQGVTGITPNGNIYFPSESAYSRDFSKEDRFLQSIFIHEMVHVWQYQHGTNVRLAALKEYVRSDFHYIRAYDYDIDMHEDFSAFNIEQQAQMVEVYFLMKHNSACDSFFTGREDDLCAEERAEVAALEKKLSPYFPLRGLKDNFRPLRIDTNLPKPGIS